MLRSFLTPVLTIGCILAFGASGLFPNVGRVVVRLVHSPIAEMVGDEPCNGTDHVRKYCGSLPGFDCSKKSYVRGFAVKGHQLDELMTQG
jgi:hypothetical protein